MCRGVPLHGGGARAVVLESWSCDMDGGRREPQRRDVGQRSWAWVASWPDERIGPTCAPIITYFISNQAQLRGPWLSRPSLDTLGTREQGKQEKGSSAPRLPPPRAPTSTSPVCPTAPYHAVSWYIPSTRTRVPSFGQTFPIKLVLVKKKTNKQTNKKSSDRPVRPRPRARVATGRSDCSHRFAGRLFPCKACHNMRVLPSVPSNRDARVCLLRPCYVARVSAQPYPWWRGGQGKLTP